MQCHALIAGRATAAAGPREDGVAALGHADDRGRHAVGPGHVQVSPGERGGAQGEQGRATQDQSRHG